MMQRDIFLHHPYITMARITVSISNEALEEIDENAEQKGKSRSQWVADALDAYLHQESIKIDADVMQELHQLRDEVMQLKHQLEAKNEELKETDRIKENLIHLRDELDAKERLLKEHLQQAEHSWRDTNQLRSEISQLKRELENSRGRVDKLQTELDNRREDAEKARNDADEFRHGVDKFKEAMRVKDDEISWLRGHVAQLTQQISILALPEPKKEEKKRIRWRFWK